MANNSDSESYEGLLYHTIDGVYQKL